MKIKRILVCAIICTFIAGLFSSCAIDKKCPAYTQAVQAAADVPA